MDTDNKLLGCIGIVVSTIGLIMLSAIVNGWALTKLWGWFVAPVFGLPNLLLIQAIGLCLIVSFFKSPKKSKEDEEFTAILIRSSIETISNPLISVLFGWIAIQFM